jgi:hypothetical protein
MQHKVITSVSKLSTAYNGEIDDYVVKRALQDSEFSAGRALESSKETKRLLKRFEKYIDDTAEREERGWINHVNNSIVKNRLKAKLKAKKQQ